jgi:hypothetical protein
MREMEGPIDSRKVVAVHFQNSITCACFEDEGSVEFTSSAAALFPSVEEPMRFIYLGKL